MRTRLRTPSSRRQDANKIAKAEQPKTVALADSSIALINTTNGAVGRLGGAVDALSGVVAKVDTVTLPKVDASVDSLNGLVSDLRPTAQASTALITEATGAVSELKLSVTTANTLLADPDITTIAHNLALTSANANVVAGNLGLVTMDVHNMLNPKKTTFWEALATAAAKSVLGSAAGPVISHFWPLGVDVGNTVTVVPAKQ